MYKQCWLLLVILSVILISEAAFTGCLPLARGSLFTALTSKSPGVQLGLDNVWVALLVYFLTYFAIDFFQSFKSYFVLKTALWYRAVRTSSVMAKIQGNPDPIVATNAPQRIQEDIKLSYWSRIEVWCEYAVSGMILMQLFLINLGEPALLASALVYAGISVYIAMKFNPRMTNAEIWSQQAEACFRTSLVNKLTDIGLLGPTNDTLMKAQRIRTEYILFTKLQLGIVAVLPYAILIPKVMSGNMGLGTLIQHQASFSLIVVNAAVLIQMFPKLIQGKASELRVKEIIK